MTGYRDVRVVIGDANRHLCAAMKKALADRGMTNLLACSDQAALAAALDDEFVDLLICDPGMLGGEFRDLIQRVRRGLIGRNPYVAVVATLHRSAAADAKEVLNAGADELVLKPITAEDLFERVSALIQDRKPYVVSHDYVGPSRRHTQRTDEDPTRMRSAPNTLRYRMVDLMGNSEVQRMVERAAARLGDDQFDTSAMEIDRLIKRISAYKAGSGKDVEWRADVERLQTVGEDLRLRHAGTASAAIAHLAEMLKGMARRMLARGPREASAELDLLAQLDQSMQRVISGERNPGDTVELIAEIIARFAARDAKSTA